MTTNDVFRKLALPLTGRCEVCGLIRLLEFEDLEVGLTCEPCMEHLKAVDIALNCDLPINLCRPHPPDTDFV